jgi:hypothetical protein
MTNTFTKFVNELLTIGFKFECNLINRWDIECGQKSIFAQFICKFRGFDAIVIDSWNCESVLEDLNEKDMEMSAIEREKWISQHIIQNCSIEEINSVPIHIIFDFSLDTTSSTFKVFFNIVDIKPKAKNNNFINFLKENIRSKVESESILVIDDDIFIL